MDTYIEELRDRLIDYYGTAMYSGFGMAVIDIARIENMDDEEIIEEARRVGII